MDKPKEEKSEFTTTYIELDDTQDLQLPEGILIMPIKHFDNFCHCVGSMMRSSENDEIMFFYNNKYIYHISRGGMIYTKLPKGEYENITKLQEENRKMFEEGQRKKEIENNNH